MLLVNWFQEIKGRNRKQLVNCFQVFFCNKIGIRSKEQKDMQIVNNLFTFDPFFPFSSFKIKGGKRK